MRLRKWRYVPFFILAASRSWRQALASEGCLAADVRTQGARVFWTRTLWRDKAAMRAYMRDGAHGAVMPKLQHWCDEASLVDWEGDALPEWEQAEARLRSAGRVSRVRHPSPAHARGETVPAWPARP